MWDSSHSICDIMENIFFNLEVIFLEVLVNKRKQDCKKLLVTASDCS